MPVFPITNSLPLKLIVIVYVGAGFFISLPKFSILLMMIIVFKFSANSNQISREVTHDSGQEAIFSEKASITLTLSLWFFWVIIFLFDISYGDYYFYEVTLIQNLSIHMFNFLVLLLNTHLFCKIVWLNRFRDLFWWMLISYVLFTLFGFLPSSTIPSFLNPNLFSQECSYKDISFLIAMTPVSLYLKR